MAVITSPLMCRLRLGARIRELRDARKLTGEQLGAKTGMGRIAISRMERGERRTRLSAVLKVLDALEIGDDTAEYRALMRVARAAEERGWWESSRYAGMGDRQAQTADVESGAKTIREYQPIMLPGLLQTPDYARERAETLLAEGDEFDLDVTLAGRLRRQEQLRGSDGPEYEAIVEVQAIDRLVVSPAVMASALAYLLDLRSRGIGVRVLPVDARLNGGPVPRSPFSLYTYAEEDPLIVAVDTVDADLLITDAAKSATYARLYERLRVVALSAADSAELIQQAAERLSAEARA